MAAIYGKDTRQDIAKLPQQWKQVAEAVAVALPSFYLTEFDADHYTHTEANQRPYAQTLGLCQDVKFAQQKTFGHCTAFLIHPQIVVSAGHCFLPAGTVMDQAHSYCDNFSFWFGYNNQKTPVAELGARIEKRNVAQCKKVIYATNNQAMLPEDNPIDFAIYELKQPITHIQPLKISNKKIQPGDLLTSIGHPQGLPAKHTGFTPLIHSFDTTLSAYIDSLSGDSGSPAFNQQGEVIGILISGHQYDTYNDTQSGCDRLNHCTNQGKNCNKSTRLGDSNLLLKNKVWRPHVQAYLSKKDIKLSKQQ